MRIFTTAALVGAVIAASAMAEEPAVGASVAVPGAAPAQGRAAPDETPTQVSLSAAEARMPGESSNGGPSTAPEGKGQVTAAESGPEGSAASEPSSKPIVLSVQTTQPNLKPPPGYKAVKKGLTTVYCKDVTPIGSRMPRTSCITEAQAQELEKQAEADRNLMREKARMGGTSVN